jgi:hypothetical protein
MCNELLTDFPPTCHSQVCLTLGIYLRIGV